jgi:hypothetical protein
MSLMLLKYKHPMELKNMNDLVMHCIGNYAFFLDDKSFSHHQRNVQMIDLQLIRKFGLEMN